MIIVMVEAQLRGRRRVRGKRSACPGARERIREQGGGGDDGEERQRENEMSTRIYAATRAQTRTHARTGTDNAQFLQQQKREELQAKKTAARRYPSSVCLHVYLSIYRSIDLSIHPSLLSMCDMQTCTLTCACVYVQRRWQTNSARRPANWPLAGGEQRRRRRQQQRQPAQYELEGEE